MKIKTVRDLKQYLEFHKLSPEELARKLNISNMTIRRLVKKPLADRIPEKYTAQFDQLSTVSVPALNLVAPTLLQPGPGGTFEPLLSELEVSGSNVQDESKLAREAKEKLLDPAVGFALKENVLGVIRGISKKGLSLKTRAICLGALIYFINPFDLIPDAIPVLGYMDDLAVLALAMSLVLKETRKKADQEIE